MDWGWACLNLFAQNPSILTNNKLKKKESILNSIGIGRRNLLLFPEDQIGTGIIIDCLGQVGRDFYSKFILMLKKDKRKKKTLLEIQLIIYIFVLFS